MASSPESDGGTTDDSKQDLGNARIELEIGKHYRADVGPRPVNRDEIRQFHNGSLDRALELEIRDLIVSFRDWADASRQILIEELRGNLLEEGNGCQLGIGPK